MSDHNLTVEWDRHGSPRYSFGCTAAADAICHAQFTCECEEYAATGIDEDGRPWHALEVWHEGDGLADDIEVRHFGTFDPDDCSLREWFENTDEAMRGSVTFPVAAEWEGDYYTFLPVGGAA